MDRIDYPYVFDEWLRNERSKLRRRKKSFVGDRRYRHFDGAISIVGLESNSLKLAETLKSPNEIAHHSFYPFLRKDQKVRLYKQSGIGQKLRPIMYASHADACIYSFYAFILKQKYEARIKSTPLNDAVIAYRKIPRHDVPSRGKSNIELAKDVYDLCKQEEHCEVLCVDIKGFFDNMDHRLIKEKWVQLIEQKTLPKNHFAVYKNITSYRYVFLHEALARLGYGRIIKGRFKYFANKRRKGQLCYPRAFNEKIDPRGRSIVHRNRSTRGIPQGSPISDVLANVYLHKFDASIINIIAKFKFGHYRRYSDDILIICPPGKVKEIYSEITAQITKEKLSLQAKKTEAFLLNFQDNTVKDLTYEVTALDDHQQHFKEAFQYLGFEIDTRDMHLRSGTIAAHYRRAKQRAKPKRLKKRIPKKSKQKRRSSHWQYLIRSGRILESKRIDRQMRKVIKRSRKF